MTMLTQSIGEIRKPWQWMVIGGAILLVWAALAIPALNRSRPSPGQQTVRLHEAMQPFSVSLTQARAVSAIAPASLDKEQSIIAPNAQPIEAGGPRKIIRTSSLEIIVAHPAETARSESVLSRKVWVDTSKPPQAAERMQPPEISRFACQQIGSNRRGREFETSGFALRARESMPRTSRASTSTRMQVCAISAQKRPSTSPF